MEHFTGPQGGKDPFGSVMNAETHRINMAMTTAPQSLQDISDATGIENLERIRQHMRWLIKHHFAEQFDQTWALNAHSMKRLHGRS